ncbi:GerMN domain-containing protein [Dethiosulfatibacter aminovorans]|nr:GerMN domain-containing protein [Dethiosulfatibacter aminovorans]
MKNKIMISILAVVILLTTSCTRSEDDVIRISPFSEEENVYVQLYLPNKSMSCIITELSGVYDLNEAKEIEETLDIMQNRTMESGSFVSMEYLKILNTSVVSDTVFIEYYFDNGNELDEMEECLMLYSIVNTATNYENIDFVKLTNSNGSNYFSKYFNIESPFTPTNTLLYKDYISPIETVEKFLNSVIVKNIPDSAAEAKANNIFYNTGFDIVSYKITKYEYNKYGEYVTVKTNIMLQDSSGNYTNENISFLLELSSGKYKIKEIVE